MQAVLIRGHGDLDCVEVAEIAMPSFGEHEVLLEVRAAALNHLDIWVRKGGRIEIPLPHVLGSDVCGIVKEVGTNVTTVAPGEEVIVNPGLWCGECEFCQQGQHSLCASYGIIGLSRSGVFAEYAVVPSSNCFLKPPQLNYGEAAALGIAYLTAWRMLITKAKLQSGQSVLIHGIGGGAALAGLQIATLAGAQTIVTSSSDEKLARAQELGADIGINYKVVEDVAAEVRSITKGRGVDVIFDTTGAATWPINEKAVRRGGTIVHCGVTTGAKTTVQIQNLYWNQLNILGSTMGTQEEFRAMLKALEVNGVKPVIDTVYPLSEAKEAMQRMESGEQFGKIILESNV